MRLTCQLIFSFFSYNMLGNIELNVDTTNNHPAHTSYFTNPSKKQSFWKSPISYEVRNADDVSIDIVTTTSATMFKPAIFVCHKSGTYRLVTAILVHINIIST